MYGRETVWVRRKPRRMKRKHHKALTPEEVEQILRDDEERITRVHRGEEVPCRECSARLEYYDGEKRIRCANGHTWITFYVKLDQDAN
jgi:LSD1 subclass zinc finger protein